MKKTKGEKEKQKERAETRAGRCKYAEWLEEEGLLRIGGWAQDGCTDEEIAKNMGVAYSTLRAWRDRFPALSAALKRARDVADRKVERRLFDRTQGYTVKVKKAFKLKKEWYDENGKKRTEERMEYAEEEVHIPADTKAQVFWLINRKPDVWRSNPELKQDEGQLPDDGLKESLTAAAARVCAATDDSDMLPEYEDDGKNESG